MTSQEPMVMVIRSDGDFERMLDELFPVPRREPLVMPKQYARDYDGSYVLDEVQIEPDCLLCRCC